MTTVRSILTAAVLLVLGAGPARADRVEDLCRTLINDSSWRVRLQAIVVLGKLHDTRAVPPLVRALGDDNETVRGVAAQVLGDLGDDRALQAIERVRRADASAYVRGKAESAYHKLRAGPPEPAVSPTPSSRSGGRSALHVEVGGVGAKARTVTPELRERLRAAIIRELERTPGLTLEGKPLSGFLIDSSITSVSRRITPDWVEISCEVSFIVGRLPSRAMVMMTSGGATVQAPKIGLGPARERALQFDALDGAVQGAHQNLLVYLKTQHPL